MSRAVNMLIDNIEKIIIGKRIVIEHLLVALLSDGHVLIEDVREWERHSWLRLLRVR